MSLGTLINYFLSFITKDYRKKNICPSLDISNYAASHFSLKDLKKAF